MICEVKSLCDDLRVLGKQDFKHLLKWRIHIRKDLLPAQKPDLAITAEIKNEHKVDEDDKLLNEMEELTNALDRKKKCAKRLQAKRRAKFNRWFEGMPRTKNSVIPDKTRKATGMQMDAIEDGYVDHELFSLASMKGKKDLAAIDTTKYESGEGEVDDSEKEEINEGRGQPKRHLTTGWSIFVSAKRQS